MTLKDRSNFYNYMQSNGGTDTKSGNGTESNLEDFPCQLETVLANCSFDDSDISRSAGKFRSQFKNDSPEKCQDQCETILKKKSDQCNCFCQTCFPQQPTGYVKICAPLDVLLQ